MICPVCDNPKLKFRHELYDDRYGYPGNFPLFQCPSCGHHCLVADFSDIEIQNLYTTYYPRKNYDITDFRPLAKTNTFFRWLRGEKRAYSFIPHNVRVLDIGCGYGETVAYHKERGCIAVGLEADSNVTPIAQNYGLDIRVGVFRRGMFNANSFDYVTMDQVIEHVPNLNNCFSAVKEILVPKGIFILTTPNVMGLGVDLFGKKWINWHAPYHLHHFSKKSIRILAEKHGFRIRKITTITSSEWFIYQLLHNLTYPPSGQPSTFWTGKIPNDRSYTLRLKCIHILKTLKIHYVYTRIVDLLGRGDNMLVILEKTSPQ